VKFGRKPKLTGAKLGFDCRKHRSHQRPHEGLQTFAAYDVDRAVVHVGNKILHAGIVDNRNDDFGIEFDHDVDVAIGRGLSRKGTGQCGMEDGLRPQVGLALLQLPYDLVAFHGPSTA
jgi:hypothetical protein